MATNDFEIRQFSCKNFSLVSVGIGGGGGVWGLGGVGVGESAGSETRIFPSSLGLHKEQVADQASSYLRFQ